MPYKDKLKEQTNRREYYLQNRERIIQGTTAWGKANVEKRREIATKHYATHRESIQAKRKAKYQYAESGTCPICLEFARLDQDHNHQTGMLRKKICRPCNLLLGHARESVTTLRRAATYLEGV